MGKIGKNPCVRAHNTLPLHRVRENAFFIRLVV